MSIGCDATSRTAALGLLGPELGLDGHNHFEGDTSLTRNDYFLAGGDDYSFNQTLYQQMSDTCQGCMLKFPSMPCFTLGLGLVFTRGILMCS